MTDRPVHVAFTKWGGQPHWEHDSHYLGADEFGHWIGCPTGQRMSKPGTDLVLGYPSVLLAPDGAQWTAAFNADAPPEVRQGCEIYVDVTGPVQWAPDLSRVTMVDLDLDVVRRWDGTVFVDDEDEFAEHQVSFGYPPEVIADAERCCAERVADLRAGVEPFATVFHRWLALVD